MVMFADDNLPLFISADAVLKGLNYGLVFKQVFEVTVASDYWLHTFETDLPDTLRFPFLPQCLKQTHKFVGNVIVQLNSTRTGSVSVINSTLDTTEELNPERE